MKQDSSERLFERIRQLPDDKLATVNDCVAFLISRHGSSPQHSEHVAGTAFHLAWDNDEDAIYDSL